MNWPSGLALTFFLLLWYVVVSLGLVPGFLLPSPEQVLQALQNDASEFLLAFKSTFFSTLYGFVFSAMGGFLLALVFVSFHWTRRAFLPFAVFFQTVPIVAIAPLLVIWFGFGEPTVRASALIVSFFPVLANSLVGLGSTAPELRELFQVYKARRLQTLLALQIPSSLPSLFSGLEVSAGLAVIGSIVGEFVAGGGLGGLIDASRSQQRVDRVFAAILLSSLMGVIFVSAVRLVARLLLKYRPFYPKDIF